MTPSRYSRSRLLIPSIVLVLLVIAGCKVGPNYQSPQMPVPDAYGEATTRPSTQPAVALAHWASMPTYEYLCG